MISNYVPLEQVFERLNRIKIPGERLNPEEAKEWAYQALEKIGTYTQYVEARSPLDIVDYKSLLPFNLHTIIEVYRDIADKVLVPLTEKTYQLDLTDYDYKIANGYIYTGFETGLITLYYLSFPTSESGSPLIPDSEMFISAVEHYIRFMLGYRAYWNRNIVFNELNMLEQRWLFYCMAARNQVKTSKMDARTIKGVLYRNFPQINRGNIKL